MGSETNTSDGASVSGDVNITSGDFVGRDKTAINYITIKIIGRHGGGRAVTVDPDMLITDLVAHLSKELGIQLLVTGEMDTSHPKTLREYKVKEVAGLRFTEKFREDEELKEGNP